MLSEGKLEELEKVAREATEQGEWVAVEPSGGGHLRALTPKPNSHGCIRREWTPLTPRDRDHIATFDPPTALALISELRALRAERKVEP